MRYARSALAALSLILLLVTPSAALVSTAQVSCDTTAVVLLPANQNAIGWILTNTSTTVTVYLGASAVTTSTGEALLAESSLSDGGSAVVNDPIYCVAASAVTVTRMVIQ